MAGKSPRKTPYTNGTKVYVFYEGNRCQETNSEWWPATIVGSAGVGKKITYTVMWEAVEDTDRGKRTAGVQHQYIFPSNHLTFSEDGAKMEPVAKVNSERKTQSLPNLPSFDNGEIRSKKRSSSTYRSPGRSKRIDDNVRTQMNIISSIQAQQTQMQIVLQNILALVEQKPGAQEALIGNISRLSSLSGLSSLAWSESGSVSGGSPSKTIGVQNFADKEAAFAAKGAPFSNDGVKRQKSSSSSGTWKTASDGGWTQSDSEF